MLIYKPSSVHIEKISKLDELGKSRKTVRFDINKVESNPLIIDLSKEYFYNNKGC